MVMMTPSLRSNMAGILRTLLSLLYLFIFDGTMPTGQKSNAILAIIKNRFALTLQQRGKWG